MSKLILYTSEHRVHVPHRCLPCLARIYFLCVLTLHLSEVLVLMCNLPIPRDNREVTNSEGYGIIFTKLVLLLREPGTAAQMATGGPENINAV